MRKIITRLFIQVLRREVNSSNNDEENIWFINAVWDI